MHYVIDGYNLLFRLVFSTRPLQEQRQKVILDLATKIQYLHLSATIVFDAPFQLEESMRSHLKDVGIIYTSSGMSADDYILSQLNSKKERSFETVVTSDKGLAWKARRLGAKTEDVEEFVGWLNERYRKRLKKGLKETSVPIKKPVTPKPKQVPQPGKNAEESYSYYLDAFEKRYEEIEPLQPTITTEMAPQPKVKKKKPKPEKPVSDYERWLKAFGG